jgi:hypothetical protein
MVGLVSERRPQETNVMNRTSLREIYRRERDLSSLGKPIVRVPLRLLLLLNLILSSVYKTADGDLSNPLQGLQYFSISRSTTVP